MEKKLLGIYLSELRVSAGLSLKEAALQIGLQNTKAIKEWETGKKIPPLAFSDQIAITYKISKEEMIEILNFEHTNSENI